LLRNVLQDFDSPRIGQCFGDSLELLSIHELPCPGKWYDT
jgi:hypothetical protein